MDDHHREFTGPNSEVTDPAVVESLNNCLQLENGCEGVAEATTAALGG